MAGKYIPYHAGMPPTGHQVTPERLEEFRRIYKEALGEEISTQEATGMTHRLSVSPELESEIVRLMKVEHRTRSELVREALRRYLQLHIGGMPGGV